MLGLFVRRTILSHALDWWQLAAFLLLKVVFIEKLQIRWWKKDLRHKAALQLCRRFYGVN